MTQGVRHEPQRLARPRLAPGPCRAAGASAAHGAGRSDARRRGCRAAAAHAADLGVGRAGRSEEHTSELQSLMRISYAVFCLKKKKNKTHRETESKQTSTKTKINNGQYTQRNVTQ